jgi:hypothetical protein
MHKHIDEIAKVSNCLWLKLMSSHRFIPKTDLIEKIIIFCFCVRLIFDWIAEKWLWMVCGQIVSSFDSSKIKSQNHFSMLSSHCKSLQHRQPVVGKIA